MTLFCRFFDSVGSRKIWNFVDFLLKSFISSIQQRSYLFDSIDNIVFILTATLKFFFSLTAKKSSKRREYSERPGNNKRNYKSAKWEQRIIAGFKCPFIYVCTIPIRSFRYFCSTFCMYLCTYAARLQNVTLCVCNLFPLFSFTYA